MEKNTKKVLAFSVLSLFLFVFALQFVAALNVTAAGPIAQWFGSWESGDFSANIAKYLFWALVSMVVFSIGSQIPGLDKLFQGSYLALGVIFSAVVGFLSMAYITPQEVYALMTSYSALGFVVGGALPFIILFFFTMTIAVKSDSAGATQRYMSKMFAFALWILFTIFIAVKAIFPVEGAGSGTYYTLTWALVALSIVCTISVGMIFRKIQTSVAKEKVTKAKDVVSKSTKRDKMNAAAIDEMSQQDPVTTSG